MRTLARLLMYVGAFYVITAVAAYLKVMPTPSGFMAIGFIAALVTWRLISDK